MPSSRIPFSKLPLDAMIANRVNYLKKREKRIKMTHVSSFIKPLTKREEEAIAAGVITMPEFKFDHAVFAISASEMTADGLQFAFSKIEKYMGLKTSKVDDGLTIVVSP